MKKQFFFIIIFCIAFFFGTPLPSAYSMKTIVIDSSLKKLYIGKLLEYLKDTDRTLDINDIQNKKLSDRWLSSERNSFSPGLIQTRYWLRFKIKNSSNSAIKFLLEQTFPSTDSLILYKSEGKGFKKIETGDLFPFSQRPYKHKNFVFPLKLKAKASTEYYLRINTTHPTQNCLLLWSPDYFGHNSLIEYNLLMLFYGLAIVLFILYILIFMLIRWLEYLYFSFCILSFALLISSIDGVAFQYLWPNSPSWGNISLPFFISLYSIFGILFITETLETKTQSPLLNKAGRIFIILWLVNILLLFVLPPGVSILVAALSGVVSIIYVIILIMVMVFKGNRTAYFFIGAIILYLLNFLIFILMLYGVFEASLFTNWSIYFTVSIVLILFALTLTDRINTMRINIARTEKKYRSLVESSRDIIFSLDRDLKFISVNTVVEKHLGFLPEEIIGQGFLDIISETWSSSQKISRMIVEQYINDLKKTKQSIFFTSEFRTYSQSKAIELAVKLEYVGDSKEKEYIIGNASLLTDDSLLKYLKSETHVYEVENYLDNAEVLSNRLTRRLKNFLTKAENKKIKLALREMLINAIEHGNLDIDFEEKSLAMTSGNYMKYIEKRLKDPVYKDRKLHIEYFLTENSVKYRIKDEGKGFDHNRYMERDPQRSNEKELLSHGRGILLSKNIFDEITYNRKGNQVTLVKYFKL